jgi:hypothetical protein
MLGQWDRLGRRLPFGNDGIAAPRGFSGCIILVMVSGGGRMRIETPPIIIEWISAPVSNGKTEVIYAYD